MAAVLRRALRIAAVLTLAAATAAPAARAAGDGAGSLARRLAAALSTSSADSRRSSALAVDLQSGKIVYAHNPRVPRAPASNEKLAVAFAALTALGPWYRIETAVLGHGRLRDGVWTGALVLRGRGDPTLSRADLAALATQIRDAGIKRVTGAIVGDASYFDSRRGAFGWKPHFFWNECEPLSALAVDRSEAANPALEATAAFRDAARAAGIGVRGGVRLGKTPPAAFPLASVVSPPLQEIVRSMGTESDNYTAELVTKQLGAVFARAGTTPAGAAVVRKELEEAKVPLRGVRIVDGSGLSRLDRLTAQAIVAMLRAAYADPLVREAFVSALAVAGRTGTLEDRMESAPARGNVVAKTGTTNEASALSGYVKRRFAFAILQNGNSIEHSAARRSQDRFATLLASQ